MLNIRTKILVCGYLVQGADFWGSYVYEELKKVTKFVSFLIKMDYGSQLCGKK